MSATRLATIVAAIVYGLTFAIMVGVPYLLWHRKTSLETLGLTGWCRGTDIGLAPIAYHLRVATTIALAIVTSVFTGFPADQVQDTGFSAFGRGQIICWHSRRSSSWHDRRRSRFPGLPLW